MGDVKAIESKDEFDKIIAGDKLVVVDFHATWCGPCKMVAPKIKVFAGNYPEVVFVKVDVDELEDISEAYGIRAMPTFLFFKNGEKIAEVVGASAEKIEAAVKQHK